MKKQSILSQHIKFYIFSGFLILVVHYSIVFLMQKEQQRLNTESLFLDILHDSKHFSFNEKNQSLRAFLKEYPQLKDRTYQIILIDKDKLSHVQKNFLTKGDSNEINFGLPLRVNSETNSHSVFDVDSDKLSGWIGLDNAEQISVVLYHKPIITNLNSLRFWTPILTAIFLLLYLLSMFLKQKNLWKKVINYAHESSNPNKLRQYNTYESLDFGKNVEVYEEFARLGNCLNRANYQLHYRSRRLNSLLLRFERSVSLAPLPIVFVKNSGVINYMNEMFSYTFMVSLKTGEKISIYDFIEPYDKQSKSILDNLSEQKITRTVDVMSTVNQQHYQMSIMPWFANNDQLQGFTLMFNNVSQITTQLDTYLQEINYQTARIADFEKLWSVMGHELRTPLSGIIGLLELLKEDYLSVEQQDTFETLEQTTQTMLYMLNDMLDLAKADAGKLHLNIAETDIVQMCRQVSELMVGNARKQGIELLLFFEPSCVQSISTDEARLRQVLLNLFSNAIKFTKSGYVALKVYVQTVEKTDKSQQRYLYFEVLDTGIGIGEQEQKRLFTYFNQANHNISHSFGGTGLGLAISKNFIKMLGGEILVDSVAGEGSCFTVRLPISQHNEQLIYQYTIDFSDLCLISFTNQKISGEQLSKFCEHIGLSTIASDDITEHNLDNIRKQLTLLREKSDTEITPVFLIEHEVFDRFQLQDTLDDQDFSKTKGSHDNVKAVAINKLLTPFVDEHTVFKILLSMKPERMLDNQLLNGFDVHLNKPIDIELMLSKLTQVNQTFHNQEDKLSSLQHSFNAFFADNTSSDDMAIENINHTPASIKDDFNSQVILVAEDNPVNLKIISKLLTKLGYNFIIAKDGQETLDLFKEHRHDIHLILMDYRMPVMDGLEATRQIRASKESVPIIALTANDTDTDKQKCLTAGMNNFLSKPIKKDLLKEMLERYII